MLSNLDLINIVTAAIVVGIYGYIIFSSLAIRRTLAGDLYRKQALGIGAVAVAFTAIYLGNFASTNDILGLVNGVIFYAASLILLYWVDTSILAARRSDPLVRDTLKWSRLRYVIWGICIFAVIFNLSIFSSFFLLGYFPSSNYLLDVYFSVFTPLPIYVAAFSGVVVMPVAALRSRDTTLRSHLEWFFAFIIIQLALQGGLSQLYSNDIGITNLIDGIAMLIGFYPLLRSVKKLIPIYKFSEDKV